MCKFLYIYHEMLEMFVRSSVSPFIYCCLAEECSVLCQLSGYHTPGSQSHYYRVTWLSVPLLQGDLTVSPTTTGWPDCQSHYYRVTWLSSCFTGPKCQQHTAPPCTWCLTGKLCNLSYPGWTDLFAPPFTREINPWWLRLPTGLCSVWAAPMTQCGSSELKPQPGHLEMHLTNN